MASKKPTADQVKNVLGVGYFSNQREVLDNDPIEPVSMKLHIDKIQQYDHNPRHSKNPAYNELMDALRANGQEEALTITRRPGDEKYIIRRGGNTRLEIMNRLYHDAGDERFEMIDCLFMPWTSESDCIVGHLNENTTQGKMTLIDKARGYRNFKIEYEQENGIEDLGQRKLAELLKDKGSPINAKLLGIMNYALDVLEPAIPETLARGLGKPQIEKLKRLDQTFHRLAEAHKLYDSETREEQIRAEFHQLLSDHDGDEWDLGLVIHEFTQRLGTLLDFVPYNRLKFDIEECLKIDPWKVDLMSTLAEEPDPVITHETQRSSTSQGVETHKQPPEETNSDRSFANHQPSSNQPPANSTSRTSVETIPDQNHQSVEPPQPLSTESRLEMPQTSFLAGQFDLKSMRARIYTLALQFANSTRIHHCLVNWKYGYGYFMDLPKSKLNTVMTIDQACLEHFEYKLVTNRFSKDRDDAERTFAWWLLWHTQGILEFTNDPVPGYHQMPESMMKNLINQLYNPLDDRRYVMMLSALNKVMLETGGPTNMMDMAMAYTYIKPANMMKYVALLEARTQLMAYVEEHSINIWEVQS